MLQHLTISHYALIEKLDIDWHEGFSAITGETGAGKSIILGALGLLLGDRADTKSIQTNEKKCIVEGTFQLENKKLESYFRKNDIDYDSQECIIRREVMNTGKSRAFINDTPVSITILKEIGNSLIDIHSQHQNLLLHNEYFLINTLDIIANQPQILSDYKQIFFAHKKVVESLKLLQERAEKGRIDQEYLQFQLSQIKEANLFSTEEQKELENEQNILSHAEEIKQGLYHAQTLIDSEEFSITKNLRQASDTLRDIANNYPEVLSFAQRLESTQIEIDDIAEEIESRTNNIDYDPSRLAFVEERLSTIYQLEKKHNVKSIEEVLQIADDLQNQINQIENADDEIKQLTNEVEKLQKEREKVANSLTQMRKKVAQFVENELTKSLQKLGMPHASLHIDITPRKSPDEIGADRVLYLFSANKNVPLQNISDIASGGEIARLMLSLKALLAHHTLLPTIVFDEIDTGVSGNMAERMAEVMQDIAKNCQVICITHLPQIAALSTYHYKVYKDDTYERTLSHIKALTMNERVDEIAQMLSGAKLTEAAINNAKALLKL